MRGYRRQTARSCSSPAAFLLLQTSLMMLHWEREKESTLHSFLDRMSDFLCLDPTNLLMYGNCKTEGDTRVNKQRQGKVPEIPDGCTSSSVYRIWPPPRICDMTENIDWRGKNNTKMAANGSGCQHDSGRAADWLGFVWGLDPRREVSEIRKIKTNLRLVVGAGNLLKWALN